MKSHRRFIAYLWIKLLAFACSNGALIFIFSVSPHPLLPPNPLSCPRDCQSWTLLSSLIKVSHLFSARSGFQQAECKVQDFSRELSALCMFAQAAMRHLPNRRVGKASDHFLVNSNHAGVKTVRWASCQRESARPLDPPTSLRCSHKLGLTVSFPHLLGSHNMRLFWSLEAVWSTVRRGAKRCGQQVTDALRHPSVDTWELISELP